MHFTFEPPTMTTNLMPLEERVETLPDIIRSLAQQVVTRDSQLKSEKARFEEELASMKHQVEEMRLDRDRALCSVEETKLKDQMETIRVEWSIDVERIRMEDERELAKERRLVIAAKAELDLERAESRRKIELLEQAAAHEADLRARAQHEVEHWKTRYTALSEESQRHMEDWKSQFSRVATTLDEHFAATRLSSSGPSPPQGASPPTNVGSSDESPISKPRRQGHVVVPLGTTNSNPAPTTNGFIVHVPQTGSVRPLNTTATPIRPSGTGGHAVPSRPLPQTQGMSPDQASPQRSAREPPQQKESPLIHRPLKSSSSQSALPPDRVIITAHYEIKKEDDEASSSPVDPNAYPKASGSGSTRPRAVEEGEGEDEEPIAKRRKTTARRHSARRIVYDEGEARDVFREADSDQSMQEMIDTDEGEQKDDFDEMAIGAEHNHREVYGYRRVNVREVNVRPRTPPHRAHGQSVSHSGGSSSKKRKPGPTTGTGTPNGRPMLVKSKR